MATITGAKAIGMADKVGSLEVGKYADIVIYNPAVLRSTPETDPLSVLVYSGSGSAVETVLVAGRPIVQDYRLAAVDAGMLREDAERRAPDLASRAGVTPHASHPWRGIEALRKEPASQ
jgi:5-methylthioadenosine/S-adenosylhomocysteine deaminase